MIFFALLFTCACLKIQAQVNYVLNPSFEEYTKCPYVLDQIKYALHWTPIDSIGDPDRPLYQPLCTPDYCNTCDTTHISGSPEFDVNVPGNEYFYQYPRTGNGMAQIRTLVDPSGPIGLPDVRDYLQGRLYKPLTAGKNYCVTFYVSLCEISGYAINGIGAYIDDGSIDIGQDSAGCASPQTAYSPQAVTMTIVSDTMDWVQIQGLVTASGNETFITIGNFSDYAHTDKILRTVNGGSFYLIDDVSVVEFGTKPIAGPDAFVSPGSDSVTIGSSEEGLPLTWTILGSAVPIGHMGSLKVHPDTTTTYVLFLDICDVGGTDTVTVWVAPAGVGNTQMQFANLQIFPNPTTGNLSVEHAKGFQLSIYDVIGKEVYTSSITSEKAQININDLPGGVYTGQIIDSKTGAQVMRKIVKE